MTSFAGSKRSPYKQLPTMRLFNPVTNRYLHWSCKFETPTTDHAWAGVVEQARNLRDKAESWPYIRVNIPRMRKEIPD